MKNLFITGVSSGIGEYIAQKFVDKFEVYWISRNLPKNEKIKYWKCDLNDDQQIVALAQKISKLEIDVFIFNAGIWYFGEYNTVSLENEKEMLQVNLWANMVFIKNLLPKVSEKTKFIFIWSISSKNLFSGGVGYQVSKFWLRWFVWSLSKEYKNRFFLINPKIVDTNFHKNSQVKFDEYKKTALKDVYKAVKNIIDWNQTNRETDL